MIKVGHVVTSYSSAVTILKRKLAALNAYDDLDVCVPFAASRLQPEPTRPG